MEKYIGKSVYKGTAIGPINVLKKSDGILETLELCRYILDMLRSRHSRSSSRKICNSSIDIESEGTGNGKIHRKVRL